MNAEVSLPKWVLSLTKYNFSWQPPTYSLSLFLTLSFHECYAHEWNCTVCNIWGFVFYLFIFLLNRILYSFIQVVICICSLFFVLLSSISENEFPTDFFGRSPVEGNWGCFQFGVVANAAASTFMHRFLWENKSSFLRDKCLKCSR